MEEQHLKKKERKLKRVKSYIRIHTFTPKQNKLNRPLLCPYLHIEN